jgi:transcriptional regulator with XRE-family HTH domain
MADERPGLLPLAELIAGQRQRLSLSLEGTRKRMQQAADLEGKYCGATRQTIRAIERGDRIPHPDSLRWLAVGLDLPIEQVASAARQQRMKRRQLLQGAAALGGAALLPDPEPWERLANALQPSPGRSSQMIRGIDLDETIGYLGRAFTEFSTADWLLGPKLVLAAVPEHLSLITELLAVVKGETRTTVLNLGARYGEFASWLYQDRGKLADASYWADRAIEWAQQANNPLMVSYVLMRKSNQASARGDAPNAIGLAQAAQRQPRLTPRTLAVVMQQEAHGHALAGDERSAHALLDKAFVQAAASDQNGDEGPGRYCIPSYIEIQRATCWLQLGHPKRAIKLFDTELQKLPRVHRRDRGVYLARLGLAHAMDQQPEQAAALGREALDTAKATGSGRIIEELRPLRSEIARWRDLPAVAPVYQVLGMLA